MLIKKLYYNKNQKNGMAGEKESGNFIELPRVILEEANAIKKVESVCKKLNLKGKALLISGCSTYKIAGKKVERKLKSSFGCVSEIIKSADASEVKRMEEAIEKNDVSFCVAVGGGKTIDVCKLASHNAKIDFISIPTAAAHDGIASPRASIRHNKSTVSLKARAPLGVIADVSVISAAPYRLLASGCCDVVAKLTAVKDWELAREKASESFSEYAAALAQMSAEIILASPQKIREKSEEGVKNAVKALISCGVAISIAGSSRPASGSEHKFSHTLDIIAPAPALHGEQCGVGAIMMAKLQGIDWERIRSFLQEIGAPSNARELGIEDKHIVKALVKAREIRRERYTILNEANLTLSSAEKLARETKVIS